MYVLFNFTKHWLHTGVEHVSGDMFIEIPKGDAILLKVNSYIHLWISFKQMGNSMVKHMLTTK